MFYILFIVFYKLFLDLFIGTQQLPGVDRVTRMKQHRKTYQNVAKTSEHTRKINELLLILIFFGTRMKQDYQDDISFSSWYPIKTELPAIQN